MKKSFFVTVNSFFATFISFNTNSKAYSQDSLIYSQDSLNYTGSSSYWFTLGYGGNNIGPSDVLSYSQDSNNKLYSVRWSTSIESYKKTNTIVIGEWSANQDIDTWEFGLLYGVCSKTKRSLISISAGLALVEIKKTKSKTKNWILWKSENTVENIYKRMTLGIPLEAQLNFIPFKDIFGIGLFLFGNFNSEKSYYGFLFSIQFGSF